MIDKIFSGIKYFIMDVIVPNILWRLIIEGIAGIASVVGFYKIWETINKLIEAQNVHTSDYVFIAFCSVICVLNILLIVTFFVFGLKLNKDQKRKDFMLKEKEEQLKKEKEQGDNVNPENIVPPFPPLQASYKISDISFELFFKDREHIILRETVKYTVVDPVLKAIPSRMLWTGDNNAKFYFDDVSKRKGYDLEIKSGISVYNMNIIFPEERTAGYSDSYTLITEVEDTSHQMMPHLSRLIKCYTEKLSLKVTAPEGLINSCKWLISADQASDFILSGPKDVKPEIVGDKYCYKKNFEKIDLLRYYKLIWDFSNK